MEQPVNFARHFSHLVWLLLHDSTSIDQQKAALRALVTVSRLGTVHLGMFAESLEANDLPVATAFTGVADVGSQMALHGLSMITADANASAADLLGVARIIASMPVRGDGGASAESKRIAIGAGTVRFAARPQGAGGGAPILEMEFGDVVDDPFGEAMAHATPRFSRAISESPTPRGEGGGLFAQFAAAREPSESHIDLLKQLDVAVEPNAIARILDDLTLLAERAAKEGRAIVASDILHRIVKRELEHKAFDTRRIFAMTIKRLSQPAMLQAVVFQLAREPNRRTDMLAILGRAGEEGAETLVGQLSDAAQQRDRKVYSEALIELKAGIPALMHLLSDPQWFAVRNAAELLGEMRVAAAEESLNVLLRHDDERVRRAATGALMRLGTPQAMHAIQHALASAEPRLRIEAAAALVARRDAQAVLMLLRALDSERESEVQAAFLLSLGRLATPEAVQRIQRVAEPDKSLFRRKSGELRIAAVQALSEARTPEALSALRMLQGDKEQSVRDAATLALGRVARRTISIERPAPPE